jgi:hypothetical protein
MTAIWAATSSDRRTPSSVATRRNSSLDDLCVLHWVATVSLFLVLSLNFGEGSARKYFRMTRLLAAVARTPGSID